MNVTLIGATGLVGKNVLTQLLNHQDITHVTTIGRKKLASSKASSPSGQLSEVIIDPMTPDQVRELKVSAETFICCLGTTMKKAGSKEAFEAVDKDLVVAFSELAERSSAKALIIVSALGASSSSFIFYNQVKGEMQDSVSGLSIPSVAFLQPSLLIGEREEKRFGEEIATQAFKVLSPILPRAIRSKLGTRVEDLVKKILELTLAPKEGTHEIRSFE